jgi:hypothetical protein
MERSAPLGVSVIIHTKTHGRTPLDESVAEASTYTGQHNI